MATSITTTVYVDNGYCVRNFDNGYCVHKSKRIVLMFRLTVLQIRTEFLKNLLMLSKSTGSLKVWEDLGTVGST